MHFNVGCLHRHSLKRGEKGGLRLAPRTWPGRSRGAIRALAKEHHSVAAQRLAAMPAHQRLRTSKTGLSRTWGMGEGQQRRATSRSCCVHMRGACCAPTSPGARQPIGTRAAHRTQSTSLSSEPASCSSSRLQSSSGASSASSRRSSPGKHRLAPSCSPSANSTLSGVAPGKTSEPSSAGAAADPERGLATHGSHSATQGSTGAGGAAHVREGVRPRARASRGASDQAWPPPHQAAVPTGARRPWRGGWHLRSSWRLAGWSPPCAT